MASLIHLPDGRKAVQFRGPAGNRPTIRLGQISERRAIEFKHRIEDLLASIDLGQRPDKKTIAWAIGLSEKMQKRLAVLGLMDPPQARVSVGQLVKSYLDTRNVEPATLDNMQQACNNLLGYFGQTKDILRITPADAEAFLSWLSVKGGRNATPISQSTTSRRFRQARGVFRHAVRRKWIPENPFDDIRSGSEVNGERDFYVEPELFASIMKKVTDREFRAIAALARWGGLRTPSEVTRLRWADINAKANTLRIVSPKTKRHEGGELRVLPIFEGIGETLLDLPRRDKLLFPRHQVTGAALTKELRSACKRAEVELWPCPWKNMRKTRAVELVVEHGLPAATAWLGHSATIAVKHYHSVVKDRVTREAASSFGSSLKRCTD